MKQMQDNMKTKAYTKRSIPPKTEAEAKKP
jgi:hypothetical protein